MSLKDSIVIKNRFTYKTGSGGGTRGATPGEFVLRYMSRPLATENITPTKLKEEDTYITKYMAREEASETLDNIPEMKMNMRKSQKKGGVAFGYGDVALSNEKLLDVSKDIQNAFENGHTVMETVLSFREEYLKEHGIIDDDFELEEEGDYRGNIDQLKLRLAIMNGLDRLGRSYDNLNYVGVIQVDTRHVHCHLAMVDKGKGTLMYDGTQKGKFSDKQMMQLRRGIDLYLDEKQTVKMMSSSVMYDKQNALGFIKKFTFKTLAQQGKPQFLIACLPEDRNLWRASSNRKEMRKANAIVREFVTEVLSDENSGYTDARLSIEKYANYRRKNEDLSLSEYQKLIRNGEEGIITDCMNGVYSVLKRIPKEELKIETPFLDVMAMDYDAMAYESIVTKDPMLEFGFKLRSYSSRLDHHKKNYHKFDDLYKAYEDTKNKQSGSEDLAAFCRFEADYNAMLMVKYQYFLSFLPPDEDIQTQFRDLIDKKSKLKDLVNMRNDPAFKKFKNEDVAEAYGASVYNQRGGNRLVKGQEDIIDARIDRFSESIKKDEEKFISVLRDNGFDYDGRGITRKKMYAFDDVKALDLHHLGYDFPYDARISNNNINKFADMATERYDLFLKAREYMIKTNQPVSELPESDIMFMKDYADKLRVSPSLNQNTGESGQKHRHRTVALGKDYSIDMKSIISSTVKSIQFDDSEMD